MPHHKEHTTYQPEQTRTETEEEAGIHKTREAIGEQEANIPTHRESRSDSDRTDRPAPKPASEPTPD